MATNGFESKDFFPDAFSSQPMDEKPRSTKKSNACHIPWKTIFRVVLIPVGLVGCITMVIYYAVRTEKEPLRRDYCPRYPEFAIGKPATVRCFRKVDRMRDEITLVKINGNEILKSQVKDGKHNTTHTVSNDYEAALELDDEWISFTLHFAEIRCTDEGKYQFDIKDRYHRLIEINIKVYDQNARCEDIQLRLGRNGVVHCGFCPPDDVQSGYLERKPKGSNAWSKIWVFSTNGLDALSKDLDNRTSVSLNVSNGMVVFRFYTKPTWCSDHGALKWTIMSGNKEVERDVDVSVTSPIMRCPSELLYDVGDSGEFECRLCVNASYIQYSINRTKGDTEHMIFESEAIEFQEFRNKTEDNSIFITSEIKNGILILEFEITAFCINDGQLSLNVGSEFRRNIEIQIKDSPQAPLFVSSDGLLNNTMSTITCEAKTGCTPHDLVIRQLGSRVNVSIINQTQAEFVEEDELFSRNWKTTSFWDIFVTSELHDTTITCEYTYEDSRAGNVTLVTEYKAYVLHEKFCTPEMADCNFAHPYDRTLFLACRGVDKPVVMPCPAGLAFYPGTCFGECLVYFG
ncbi:hypothetical protein ScPMuIL_018411 [Solemya velum]